MGYRFEDRLPSDPEAFLPRFEMRNATTMTLAFPCFYLDVISEHDANYHDHTGWPNPSKPDCICQYPGKGYERIDFENPHPIDLMSEIEGYDEAGILFDEDISGIDSECSIQDNTVYVKLHANMEDIGNDPVECKFTVLAHSPEGEYDGRQRSEKIDQVIRATLVILPGAGMPVI